MAQQHYSSVDQQLDQDTDAVENNIYIRKLILIDMVILTFSSSNLFVETRERPDVAHSMSWTNLSFLSWLLCCRRERLRVDDMEDVAMTISKHTELRNLFYSHAPKIPRVSIIHAVNYKVSS